MKLTAKIKLCPTEHQRQLLQETLQTANAVCNYISQVAWEQRKFHAYNLHHLCYYTIREQSGLGAQMVIRAMSKVSNSYKINKRKQHVFHRHGAFPLDERLLKIYLDDREISIWSFEGRQRIPFQAGEHQLNQLQFQKGQCELAFIRGEFYLLALCEIEEPEEIRAAEFLGIDLGIANIATTSDGQTFSGKTVNSVRHRYQRSRQKLQKKNTKSAKRLLKKRSGKESRFAAHVNHTISKALVEHAQRTGRGIALEDLSDIRERVRLRKQQRTQLHSWSFYQLRAFVEYKAKLVGVPAVLINPRNTSRECSHCGHIDKRNRPNQSTFSCTSCGFSAHADVNAAINIGRRGAVSRPYVSA